MSNSMDGNGRSLDKVFIERLWWSVKYEPVDLHDHQCVQSPHQGLKTHLKYFSQKRLLQRSGYETAWYVYQGLVQVPSLLAPM